MVAYVADKAGALALLGAGMTALAHFLPIGIAEIAATVAHLGSLVR